MADSQDQPNASSGDIQQEVSENTLRYLIFTSDSGADNHNVLRQLETVRQAALKLCRDLAEDYIWQRDSFDLQLRTEGGGSAICILTQTWTDSDTQNWYTSMAPRTTAMPSRMSG